MKNRLVLIGVLTLPTIAHAESGVDRILFAAAAGAVVGGFLGLIGGLIWGISVLVKKARPKIGKLMASSASKVDELGSKSRKAISDFKASDEDKVLEIEDRFYEAASDEVLQSNQVKGLWAKSQVLANGDQKKQEAIYVRLRARQLSKAEIAENLEQDSKSTRKADQRIDELTRSDGVREGLIEPSEIPKTMKALDAAKAELLRRNKIQSVSLTKDNTAAEYHNEISPERWFLILIILWVVQVAYLIQFTPTAYVDSSFGNHMIIALVRVYVSAGIGWPLAGLARLIRNSTGKFTDLNKWVLWFAGLLQLNLVYIEQVHW